MALFSFSHLAFISLNFARMSASSFWMSARCSWDRVSVSFFRAASSISWLHDLAVEISSISAGMESISLRIMAQASSTRSMALSGRKRSVM